MFKFHPVIFILALTSSSCSIDQTSSLESTDRYFEGDIVLTPKQQRYMEAAANPSEMDGIENAVVRNQDLLWEGARVPYVLDGLYSLAKDAIREAIADYHKHTCIRFVERTDEVDYLRFFRDWGCYSYVGRIGGPQNISIGFGCEYKGIVIHEIFHALGRKHEQSRPDRDMFVRILTENIKKGKEYNFQVANPAFFTTQGVPYDIGSIMHYSYKAFSNNGDPTILPLDPTIDPSVLGQREAFSSYDIQHANTLYCAGSGSVSSWSSWSSWSLCSRTCNGGSMTRTRTCIGGTNCGGSNIEKQQCKTEPCPVLASWGTWGPWSVCSKSCSVGRQTRIRSCVRGNTCVGTRQEFSDCNTHNCPKTATWTSWSSWSSCSSTCQGGISQRTRTCLNGNTCQGPDLKNKNCNNDISCATQGFKHYACWYLRPRSRYIRSMEGTTPDLRDDPLTRVDPVSKCAEAAKGFGFNYFGVGNGHCFSGSNFLSDYLYTKSLRCRDGKGAYYQNSAGGLFVIDVYEVDGSRFSDPVKQVVNAIQPMKAAYPEEGESGSGDSSSGNRLTHNFVLISLAVFTVMLAVVM